MQLEQSITAPALLDFSISPYDQFWDLETILLVLMIDFNKISGRGSLCKEDLLAYSRDAADRKGKAAARIGAQCFQELQNLLAILNGECEALPDNQAQKPGFDKAPEITLADLLQILTYVSENPDPLAFHAYFPALRFPC
jgi:hypothetical protein